MSKGIRQFHRWTSIAFTLSVVIVTVVVVAQEEPAVWITLTPLLPLGLLLVTGLYMFVLPYVRRRRRAALEG
ncbi:hypothetical protein ACFFX1_46025 [Dactylosporangium sucinum]|uniref:Uncharacterized protein n=1 Tax=Dactylosporangium sucinum TaxID=1424081 RepID=A0A917WUK1_9ACTN|nr:hypothetical protein [Dactylosporangium sucinum]GGM31263.1 hypothetical protein GCM10007977_035630 [Dactylosporangium sucinum]